MAISSWEGEASFELRRSDTLECSGVSWIPDLCFIRSYTYKNFVRLFLHVVTPGGVLAGGGWNCWYLVSSPATLSRCPILYLRTHRFPSLKKVHKRCCGGKKKTVILGYTHEVVAVSWHYLPMTLVYLGPYVLESVPFLHSKRAKKYSILSNFYETSTAHPATALLAKIVLMDTIQHFWAISQETLTMPPIYGADLTVISNPSYAF